MEEKKCPPVSTSANEKLTVYRCSRCGLVVEVLTPGAHPVCCGEPMEKVQENTVDASREKHLPVIVPDTSGSITVKVGSQPHPMTHEHYIQWIEVQTADGICRREFCPGMEAQADFPVKSTDVLSVRAYCNIHGMWKI